MTLEEVLDMWDIDSTIDRTRLGDESLHIPKLHAKYYRMYAHAKLKLELLKKQRSKLKILKKEYFDGSIDDATLKDKGWEPRYKKILKQDQDLYMDGEPDWVESELGYAYQQEIVDALKAILQTINTRGFHIKNAVDWNKFQAGTV